MSSFVLNHSMSRSRSLPCLSVDTVRTNPSLLDKTHSLDGLNDTPSTPGHPIQVESSVGHPSIPVSWLVHETQNLVVKTLSSVQQLSSTTSLLRKVLRLQNFSLLSDFRGHAQLLSDEDRAELLVALTDRIGGPMSSPLSTMRDDEIWDSFESPGDGVPQDVSATSHSPVSTSLPRLVNTSDSSNSSEYVSSSDDQDTSRLPRLMDTSCSSECSEPDSSSDSEEGSQPPALTSSQPCSSESSEPDSSSDIDDQEMSKTIFWRDSGYYKTSKSDPSVLSCPDDREYEPRSITSDRSPTTPDLPQDTHLIVGVVRRNTNESGANNNQGFSLLYKTHRRGQGWGEFDRRPHLDVSVASSPVVSPPVANSPPDHHQGVLADLDTGSEFDQGHQLDDVPMGNTPPANSSSADSPPDSRQSILAEFATGKLVWIPKTESEDTKSGR